MIPEGEAPLLKNGMTLQGNSPRKELKPGLSNFS
jgi:hypothetical protein